MGWSSYATLDLVDAMKRWRYGVRKLTMGDLKRLRQIRSGKLIRVRPRHKRLPLESLPNAFLPLWLLRKSSFAFEIWGQHGEPQFHLWASDRTASREMEAQFRAVYPKAEFSPTESRYPDLEDGLFVCNATAVYEGEPFGLKTFRDFRYDPLSHMVELTRQADCMIQVMFRPLKKLPKKLKPWMADLWWDNVQPSRRARVPLFEVTIRVMTISDDPSKAREAIELIMDTFIILTGRFSDLRPKITSFRVPLLRDHLLEHMIRRDFPRLWRRKFILTIPELATLVHIPPETDTSSLGVPYFKPPPPDSGIALGYSTSSVGGRSQLVSLGAEDLGNVYLCGAPGTGKTTTLINLALQAFNSFSASPE